MLLQFYCICRFPGEINLCSLGQGQRKQTEPVLCTDYVCLIKDSPAGSKEADVSGPKSDPAVRISRTKIPTGVHVLKHHGYNKNTSFSSFIRKEILVPWTMCHDISIYCRTYHAGWDSQPKMYFTLNEGIFANAWLDQKHMIFHLITMVWISQQPPEVRCYYVWKAHQTQMQNGLLSLSRRNGDWIMYNGCTT